MRNNNHKVGIIGSGRMGRRHIQAVGRLGWDLAGVFDIRQSSLKITIDELGLDSPLLFNDLEEFYRAAKPECVIISTTADSHCALTCLAAEHGVKHILVEKPMAVSLEECDKMIAICKGCGASLAVNHQMRFMELYAKPKTLLNSDAYGGLKSMTVVGGNFGFAMNGSHYFEAFRYIAEEDPVEVMAWFSPDAIPNPRGPRFFDRAGSIRVVSASGKRLYMDIGIDQGHGVQVTYAARNGMVTVNELTGEMTSSVRELQYRELPTTRYGMPAEISHESIKGAEVVGSTAAVLTALVNDENSVTAEHGKLAIKVLVAAYTSAENGSVPVQIDGTLDYARIFPWA